MKGKENLLDFQQKSKKDPTEMVCHVHWLLQLIPYAIGYISCSINSICYMFHYIGFGYDMSLSGEEFFLNIICSNDLDSIYLEMDQ